MDEDTYSSSISNTSMSLEHRLVDTAGVGKRRTGQTERAAWKHTHHHMQNTPTTRICCMTRGTQTGALHHLEGWGGEGDGKGMSLCGAPPCRLCLKWIWWEAKIVPLWSQICHEPKFFLGHAKPAALVDMCGARVRSKPGLLLGHDEVASLAGRGWSRA